MGAADFHVQPEERARVEAVCYDKARKRLQAEIGIRIERLPHLLDIGNFVILKAPNNAPEPFYVAEVSSFIQSLKSCSFFQCLYPLFFIISCACRSLKIIPTKIKCTFTGSSLLNLPEREATNFTSLCSRVKTFRGVLLDSVGRYTTGWIQERR
jgi:hypothetical protein